MLFEAKFYHSNSGRYSFSCSAGKTLRFGVVMQVVFERFKKYAVAFGVMESDGTMRNAPGIGYTYTYMPDDRVIIMNRVFKTDIK